MLYSKLYCILYSTPYYTILNCTIYSIIIYYIVLYYAIYSTILFYTTTTIGPAWGAGGAAGLGAGSFLPLVPEEPGVGSLFGVSL